MIDAEFLRVAQNINFDRTGANYYSDVNLLKNYIQASFEIEEALALSLAEAIHADRKGSQYYSDPRELARFFAGKIEVPQG